MKRTVTITLEVDMNSEQCKEWRKPSDYFRESINAALEQIQDKPLKTKKGIIKTDSEKCSYEIHITKHLFHF